MYGSSQSRSACSWNTSPTASPAPSPKAATPPPPRSRKPQTPSPAWHGCAWSSPAPQALGPEAAATTLAGRPYKLRHAALSLWLNAGAAPAQIARRAGHCTTMLVAVYTHCIDAQDVITNRQIERALHPRNRAHHHITGGSADRRYRPDPVRHRSLHGPHSRARAVHRQPMRSRSQNSPLR